MKARFGMTFVALITLTVSLLNALPVSAMPPIGDTTPAEGQPPIEDYKEVTGKSSVKPIDQPNPKEVDRLRERAELLAQGNTTAAQALETANDRVLVILVEYNGTDKVTWNNTDHWDPIGQANPNEVVYDTNGDPVPGDCSLVQSVNSLPATKEFTYGPTLHNQIEQPRSATDASGNTIWTPDFSKQWYENFMFGDGVKFSYARQDGSIVNEDFTGKSVKDYYLDMSGGKYDITGDVIGWVQVPHSAWYYGTDTCAGARSTDDSSYADTGLVMGSTTDLVQDAVDAVDAIKGTLTGFDWKNYDLNNDGEIDHLWIVHAGYGEEDNSTLLNRTDYAESAIWSHSSAINAYPIGTSGVKASDYIVMPENGGIGVFAHEFGHNIGTMDLYAYQQGAETSAGFWSLMADDWVGYPLGFMPPALDPMHLDDQGWLDPKIISDISQSYTVKVGQASAFPGGDSVYRGVKIELPDIIVDLPILPATGKYGWWGGNLNETNATMTLTKPIAVPAGGASFDFAMAYGIESNWDFLWVQASVDGGTTWNTLTNADTTCLHVTGWIGEKRGFPKDLCAAGIGGFTDYNASFPDYDTETFSLDGATYGGKNVTLRFWYMTDWGTTYEGPYIDDIQVTATVGGATLFSDGAEVDNGNWAFTGRFMRNNGQAPYKQNYYLQWRNTTSSGGYDSGLGEERFRFGPANTGLLVWYENEYYNDNEVWNNMWDSPSVGPKGRMLVIDSHPDPMRDPYWVAQGWNNEGGNITTRGSMRDATFSTEVGQDYIAHYPISALDTLFEGKAGISFFDDSLGYYAGAEYVSRGPGYSPPSYAWVTKQYDSSAVVPGTKDYPLDAPGYKGNQTFRFDCQRDTSSGRILCYGLAGLGIDGGTGNPGDYAAQYGWHVDVMSQTNSEATLRIYNTNGVHTFGSDVKTQMKGNNVTFTYQLNAFPGDATNVFACTDIDKTKVAYVSGTNVIGLTSPCANLVGLSAQSLTEVTTTDPSKVVAVALTKLVQPGDTAGFTFTVTVLNTVDKIAQQLNIYEGSIHRLYEADVTVNTDYFYMPIIAK